MTQAVHAPSGYGQLTDRIRSFGAFRKRWAWLHGLAWFVILGPGALLAWVAIDALSAPAPVVARGARFTLNVAINAPELEGQTVAVCVDEQIVASAPSGPIEVTHTRLKRVRNGPLAVRQNIRIGGEPTKIAFEIEPDSVGLATYRVSMYGANDAINFEKYHFAQTVSVKETAATAASSIDLKLPGRWWSPLPWYLLLPLFAVAAVLTLCAAFFYGLRPLLARIDIDHEALLIESLHGNLDNQVIGSLQLGREVLHAQTAGKPVAYSVAFASALVTQTAARLDALNTRGLIDRKKSLWVMCFAGAILLISGALFAAKPEVFSHRILRLHDAYSSMQERMFPVKIVAASGRWTYFESPLTMHQRVPTLDVVSEEKPLPVVRGTLVFLGAEVVNSRQSDVRLIRTDVKTNAVTIQDLPLDVDHIAIANPLVASESFTYQFESGGRRSAIRKIIAGDVPAIAAMNTELTYPTYTRLPSRTLIGKRPKISALKGTQVLVSLASTVDLDPRRSFIRWSDGQVQELAVTGRFAHFFFVVDQSTDGEIHLTGSMGKEFEMSEPFTFHIDAQEDAPPKVELVLSPKLKALGATQDGVPVFVDQTAHFAMTALGEDDFGVTDMTIRYTIDTRDKHREDLPSRDANGYVDSFPVNPSQERVKHTFTDIFKKLGTELVPGERVTITVTATDNKDPSPQTRTSEPFVFTVVRPDLSTYTEQQFGFDTDPMLGRLRKVKRATNLLIEAERTTRTEAKAPVEKQAVKSRVGAENWPGGSQDAVGDYFRLLSGEK